MSSQDIQATLRKANIPVKSVHYSILDSSQHMDAYVLVLSYTNKSVIALHLPINSTCDDVLNILHSTNPELFI
jgi:tRNA A37 methylthiotransferase MiaB